MTSAMALRIPDSSVPEWSRRLRRARRAKGLSQAALGDLIGASQATVADWETGKTRPRHETLKRLLLALDLALLELMPDMPRSAAETMAQPPLSAGEVAEQFGALLDIVSRELDGTGHPAGLSSKGRFAFQIWRSAGGTMNDAADPEAAREQLGAIRALLADMRKLNGDN
ncbi:MAG: Helix-turn-helix domain [Pseudomonadota bacterium]